LLSFNKLLHYTRLTVSFPGQPGEAGTRKVKTNPDLNGASDNGVLRWQWHQLEHMLTICTSLQADNHTNTSSINFYRRDALPNTQPRVSSTEGHIKIYQKLNYNYIITITYNIKMTKGEKFWIV